MASICTTANRMIQSHTSLIKKGNIKGISRLEVPFNRHLQWIVSLSSWMILSFSIMKEDKHDSFNRRSRLPSVVKLSCCIQSHLCYKHLGASVKACDVEDNYDGVTLDEVFIVAARIIPFYMPTFPVTTVTRNNSLYNYCEELVKLWSSRNHEVDGHWVIFNFIYTDLEQ